MASTPSTVTATHERLQARCEMLRRIAAVQDRTNDPGYMSNVAKMIVDEELCDIIVCTQMDEVTRGVMGS